MTCAYLRHTGTHRQLLGHSVWPSCVSWANFHGYQLPVMVLLNNRNYSIRGLFRFSWSGG